MSLTRMTRRCVAILIGAFSLSAASVAGAQGVVTGRVVAQGTNEPIPEARVILIGTSLFTVTNNDGRFTVRNVPAGTQQVRVLRVGFGEQKKPATVTNGQATTLDFQLATVSVRR